MITTKEKKKKKTIYKPAAQNHFTVGVYSINLAFEEQLLT